MGVSSIWMYNDCIASEGCGEQMQRALQRLREAGVLEYSAQRKNYLVTPPRQAALEMLREHGNQRFIHLMARVRRQSNQE